MCVRAGSGSIEYSELNKILRRGADGELAAKKRVKKRPAKDGESGRQRMAHSMNPLDATRGGSVGVTRYGGFADSSGKSVSLPALGPGCAAAPTLAIREMNQPSLLRVPAPPHTSRHLFAPPCTSPHLPAPLRTSLHLATSPCTSPHLPAPHRTSLHLATSTCTSPHLTTPPRISLHLSAPPCTCLHLSTPPCTSPHLSLPLCTSMHLPVLDAGLGTTRLGASLLLAPSSYLPDVPPRTSFYIWHGATPLSVTYSPTPTTTHSNTRTSCGPFCSGFALFPLTTQLSSGCILREGPLGSKLLLTCCRPRISYRP